MLVTSSRHLAIMMFLVSELWQILHNTMLNPQLSPHAAFSFIGNPVPEPDPEAPGVTQFRLLWAVVWAACTRGGPGGFWEGHPLPSGAGKRYAILQHEPLELQEIQLYFVADDEELEDYLVIPGQPAHLVFDLLSLATRTIYCETVTVRRLEA